MKLLQIALLILLVNFAFTQEVEIITVAQVEYVWERQAGDNRIVVAKDSAYQKMLKASIANGIAGKRHVDMPSVDLKVIKLPSLRTQPKFTTSVSNADSTKRYLFLQFYDASIPINTNNTSFSARINVKYRLIAAGAENTDRYVSYKVFRRNPQPGQTVINRFPFLPMQFKMLCDTIVNSILNDETENEKEIWLDPACGYDEEHQISNPVAFQFSNNRHSVTVSGDNGFSMLLDSVTEERTGKVKHGVGNTASTLLTFFSNIDTDKKRSARYSANHTYSEGSSTYHAYINYVDSKVAERRRVKDEDGNKSIETGD
ncbi:MAG TPA: hypothetical protein VNS32_27025, partial [Flavisolibacter sp.]|nr:hypothetical protein [Flavisolibacter sp.]